ncbi:MAG: FliH protein, partial [Candidatus Hydrogenedentes bacterium]|nr:FliH protein [Candidatus Hydrogenedentota bacterium]
MAKIFKANDAAPRMLADYERATLEEPRYEDPAAYTEELPAVPGEEEILTRETILAEARAEAERKVQEAYQAGLERGIGAGRKQFSESIGRSAEALDLAAEAIREANDAFLASLEPEVVKLVRQIAEALIHREVQTDPELI